MVWLRNKSEKALAWRTGRARFGLTHRVAVQEDSQSQRHDQFFVLRKLSFGSHSRPSLGITGEVQGIKENVFPTQTLKHTVHSKTLKKQTPQILQRHAARSAHVTLFFRIEVFWAAGFC